MPRLFDEHLHNGDSLMQITGIHDEEYVRILLRNDWQLD